MKSATEVLQDALFSAFLNGIDALKNNAGGLPNNIVRDVNTMHSNTTFESLPEAIQKAIKQSTQDTLRRLNKEGLAVSERTYAKAPRVTPRVGSGNYSKKREQGK